MEFADFQCPYCKAFAEQMESIVLPTRGESVYLVFRQMPFASHSWALRAAKASVCAEDQNKESFWSFHNRFFLDQEEINGANFDEHVMAYARSTPKFDEKSFLACIKSSMAMERIRKDVDLAFTNRVDATPTVFINGTRVVGSLDAVRINKLIDKYQKHN